jgi:hypothetical protein
MTYSQTAGHGLGRPVLSGRFHRSGSVAYNDLTGPISEPGRLRFCRF